MIFNFLFDSVTKAPNPRKDSTNFIFFTHVRAYFVAFS